MISVKNKWDWINHMWPHGEKKKARNRDHMMNSIVKIINYEKFLAFNPKCRLLFCHGQLC